MRDISMILRVQDLTNDSHDISAVSALDME